MKLFRQTEGLQDAHFTAWGTRLRFDARASPSLGGAWAGENCAAAQGWHLGAKPRPVRTSNINAQIRSRRLGRRPKQTSPEGGRDQGRSNMSRPVSVCVCPHRSAMAHNSGVSPLLVIFGDVGVTNSQLRNATASFSTPLRQNPGVHSQNPCCLAMFRAPCLIFPGMLATPIHKIPNFCSPPFKQQKKV